eukprot:9308429-Lingulodinium_polyedra.AAC.1
MRQASINQSQSTSQPTNRPTNQSINQVRPQIRRLARPGRGSAEVGHGGRRLHGLAACCLPFARRAWPKRGNESLQ